MYLCLSLSFCLSLSYAYTLSENNKCFIEQDNFCVCVCVCVCACVFDGDRGTMSSYELISFVSLKLPATTFAIETKRF